MAGSSENVLEYETPRSLNRWAQNLATGASLSILGSGLFILSLVAGDLIFWNVGPVGLVVTLVLMLGGDVLVFQGTWLITAVQPGGGAQSLARRIVRLTMPIGIVNLDAIIFFLILPGPMARWGEWLIGITAAGVVTGAVAQFSHLGQLVRIPNLSNIAHDRPDVPTLYEIAGGPNLTVIAAIMKIVFSLCYTAFVTVVLVNAVECDALNRANQGRLGYFLSAFASYDAYAGWAGFASFFCALIYLFLLQRIRNRFSATPVQVSTTPVQAGFFQRRKTFLVTVGLLVVATIIYYPFSPANLQSRNMDKARAHIPVVRRALANDARFANLSFTDFTASGGSLRISGFVPTRKDVNDLKTLVASTSPPTVVIYAVFSQEDQLQYAPATVP
ncbi:MAG: hypothetical protein ABSB42_17995 [Tepidisphaeraceae bacterium]|jgi:hypothetical protein